MSATRSLAHQPAVSDDRHDQETATAPTNGGSAKPEAAEAKARRLNPIKRKQMETRLREVEEEIARVEVAIALYEKQLQTFVSAEEQQRQTRELGLHKTDLQHLMSEWEELTEMLG